jgi:hypothetical protein
MGAGRPPGGGSFDLGTAVVSRAQPGMEPLPPNSRDILQPSRRVEGGLPPWAAFAPVTPGAAMKLSTVLVLSIVSRVPTGASAPHLWAPVHAAPHKWFTG